MKSPAFQFYPSDYMGSQRVRLMTLEEEGAYINLLCSCWLHGSIPADPELAARIIGKGASTTLATTVLTMFAPSTEQGRLVHERLEDERDKQAAWRNKSAAGGRKSAEMRKGGSRVVEAPHQPNGNTSSSSSSSNIQTDLPVQRRMIPSLEEWIDYTSSKYPDWPIRDTEGAWRYYESLGWMNRKTPIVKWKMCASTCYQNFKSNPRKSSGEEIVRVG